MLEKVKALRSKLVKGGGQSRTDKQSPEPVEQPTATPEVRVLDYLRQHQDELISYKGIARGSGVSQSKVGRIINELVGTGTVVRSTPNRHGTRYWINSESKSDGKNSEKGGIIGGSAEDDIDYVKITNELIWAFIRETRTTDLLLFLTWLERKGGDNA